MTFSFTARSTRVRSAAVVVASAAAVCLSACGSSGSTAGNPLAPSANSNGGVITVGSNNFSESTILADIYGHALAAKGFQVKYHPNIGSREISYGLMKSGALTLMPEYNGALLDYLDPKAVGTSTADVDAKAAAKLAPTLQLLNPAAAEDKDTLTVNTKTAKALGLSASSTISSLAKVANTLVMGGSPEFQTREQGLVGLKSSYGLTFKGYKSLDAGGTLTETALQNDNVQIADIFTTDALIQKDGWVTLTDDKSLFGFQNVVPLADKSLPSGAADVLNQVSAKLTTAGLMQLDAQVGAQGADPGTVADSWLKANGIS
ncbi:glycine/betaine ABC transporter substrate-binding protein [Streptacidiphilus pinicola]|uniref:Glycine/betaine ABC transporter substrate-binding protein n=1 Tax=Streptacidiphilus pinicola TaxID=2219663 RepID=A0A2X0ID12_9ACTN|nr:ABC transporter substrate-binding protein [Streptacidiphilus pinicola]RAG82882.1 glycine/betaine ABC transporter substrate-binding protein [Streptacidiphilus pinicola]